MKIKYPYHKFLIGGDFNAYTNQELIFIQFDSMTYINDDIEYVEDTFPAARYITLIRGRQIHTVMRY